MTGQAIDTPISFAVEARPLPPLVFAYGFSARKRAIVRRFAGSSAVRFVRRCQQLPPDAVLLLWGRRPVPAGVAQHVRIVRLEDGFLRSVGLGADLVQPLSWVLDQRGMYYDATCESDLEHLLQTTTFGPDLLARAARLRHRIIENGLTKYNIGTAGWHRPIGKHVILVPGQVESDASLRFGAPLTRTNMGLLQQVRAANPHAHIVYKPHPDVVAGLRGKGWEENGANQWCDEVVSDVGMANMLAAVDEVHVLTSLAGFEALLRGLPVTCYGQPFYAGWGLTADVLALPRRTRRLLLDELVAAALIVYPRYASRATGALTTPEQALDELLAWKEVKLSKRASLWRNALRGVLRVWGRNR